MFLIKDADEISVKLETEDGIFNRNKIRRNKKSKIRLLIWRIK